MKLGPEYFQQRMSKFYDEINNEQMELGIKQAELAQAMDLLKDEIKLIEENISQNEKDLSTLRERFEIHTKNTENVIINMLHSKRPIASIAADFEKYESQFVENDLEIEKEISQKTKSLNALYGLYQTKS